MRHEWVLDVIADLSVFARENRLPALAEHLQDARHIAVAELAREPLASPLPAGMVGADARGVRDGV